MEVGSNEEHNEGEVEQIVHDEVATNTGGGMLDVRVAGEQVTNVTGLENEEDNPALVSMPTEFTWRGTYQKISAMVAFMVKAVG